MHARAAVSGRRSGLSLLLSGIAYATNGVTWIEIQRSKAKRTFLSQNVVNPTMRAALVVTVLASALVVFAHMSNAGPVFPNNQPDLHEWARSSLVTQMQKLMEHSADAIARVRHTAAQAQAQELKARSSLANKKLSSNHHSRENPPPGWESGNPPGHGCSGSSCPPPGSPNYGGGSSNPCVGANSPACTGNMDPSVMQCFTSAFAGLPDMRGFFALPQMLCQLSSANASCATTIMDYMKTCNCIDFKPIFDMVCQSSPTAHACSRNTYLQQLIAAQTVNNTLFDTTFFPQMPMPDPNGGLTAPPLDLSICGDRSLLRDVLLINNMGDCLDRLLDAFPVVDVTYPGGSPPAVMRSFLKCSVSWKPYYLQATCSGNLAKCYSAVRAPSSQLPSCQPLALTTTPPNPKTCPSGCSSELAAFGSGNSSVSCCVEWFKGLASDSSACRSPAPPFP